MITSTFLRNKEGWAPAHQHINDLNLGKQLALTRATLVTPTPPFSTTDVTGYHFSATLGDRK
jgi:hypothetical protein